MALRIQLIEALYGVRYSPRAICTACNYALRNVEILQGFRDDPHDYTTLCPKCAYRFQPQLASLLGGGDWMEVQFYCEVQALHALPAWVTRPPADMERDNSSLYRSCITHFGSLNAGFARLKMPYPFDPLPDWREKAKSFLGKLPDTMIAQCVGQHVRIVRAVRKQLGIPRYVKKRATEGDERIAADEAGDHG